MKRIGSFVTVVVLAACSQFLTAAPPVLLGRLVDHSVGAGRLDTHLACLIIGLAVVAFVVDRLLSKSLSRFASKLIHERFQSAVSILLTRERRLHAEFTIGEIIDVFSRYINSFEQVLTVLLSNTVPAALAIIIFVTAIFMVSSPLVWSVVVAIQVLLFVVSYWNIRLYSRKLKGYTKACYGLSDEWVEILGNSKIIQANNAFSYASRRLDQKLQAMVDNLFAKTHAENRISSSNMFLSVFSSLTVISVLLVEHVQGRVSVGGILTTLTLSTLLQGFNRQIVDFLISKRNYDGYRADFERISGFDSFVNHESSSVAVKKFETIRLDPLRVVKEGRDILKLTQSLEFQKGEKVAIIGLSGSGKTTLMSLFFHANRDLQEHVFVNGIPTHQLAYDSIQTLVKISFQENDIMSGSHFEDWLFCDGRAETSSSLLADLHLPSDIIGGTRTLQPYSGNISGGEAKRLNVARLLRNHGEMNVLDEPTTGLNRSLTNRVWDVIFRDLADKTLLCSTHDLDALGRFDRVLIVDEGEVVADIPPTALPDNVHYLRICDRL